MLFTTIADFNLYSDGNSAIDFLSIKPSIEHAQIKYITPLLGVAYVDAIETKIENNSLSVNETKFVKSLKSALANFSLYEYAPIVEVQISDKGIRRGDSQELPGAYKYQTQEYRTNVLDRGFLHLENALLYLDKIVEDGEDAIAYTDSVEFIKQKDTLITSGAEFQDIISTIKYPRRFFLLLRTSILNIQRLTIKNAIKPSVYNSLLEKNHHVPTEFTAFEKELLIPLKNAIAHLALARGISSIVASMDENGIHVLSNSTDSSNSTSKRTSASDNVLRMIINDNESAGASWLQEAIQYIKDNCTTEIWEDWYNELHPIIAPPTENEYSGLASF